MPYTEADIAEASQAIIAAGKLAIDTPPYDSAMRHVFAGCLYQRSESHSSDLRIIWLILKDETASESVRIARALEHIDIVLGQMDDK